MRNELAVEVNESDSFVVHLVWPPEREVRVSSVELLLPDMRNRYSFKNNRLLDDIFVPEVSAPIRDALSRVSSEDRLVALPDLEISVPGLILSGLRILITMAADGIQYVMLRFRRFVGTLNSAFQFEPAMVLDSAVAREQIAIEVLNDIVTPLFDIMSLQSRGLGHLYETHGEALAERIAQIETRKEELTFHINLLQRYIAGCQSDIEERRNGARAGSESRARIDDFEEGSINSGVG